MLSPQAFSTMKVPWCPASVGTGHRPLLNKRIHDLPGGCAPALLGTPFPGVLQLLVALLPDFLLAAFQLVLRRDVSNRAVQPNFVVSCFSRNWPPTTSQQENPRPAWP